MEEDQEGKGRSSRRIRGQGDVWIGWVTWNMTGIDKWLERDLRFTYRRVWYVYELKRKRT
jgi:hypothetical protein